MNEELKIISDTGEESKFQTLPLFDEQFMEIGRVIQEHYDYFKDKIDNEFNDLYKRLDKDSISIEEKFDNYNLKIIDLFYNFQKQVEANLIETTACINEKLKVYYNDFNEKINNIVIQQKEDKDNIEFYKNSSTNSILKIFALLEEHYNKFKEHESINVMLEHENVDKTMSLETIQKSISFLIDEVKQLKEQSHTHKLPWYKRLFKK
jgi:hypothetical protein